MKVAYISDLHADFCRQNRMLLPHLVDVVCELNPDLFVIAGDVASTLDSVGSTLAAFKPLMCARVKAESVIGQVLP